MLFSSVVAAFLIASTFSKRVPLGLDDPFELEEETKSHGARSGEKGGCSTTSILFPAKNSRILGYCEPARYYCDCSHEMASHISCLMSRTERSFLSRTFFMFKSSVIVVKLRERHKIS